MATPLTLILSGYGINCEEETAFAFERAGARTAIVHVNDLIEDRGMLERFNIFVFPGGFSYGDDTGSGLALANRIKNNMLHELARFMERDTLTLGICNGFQVMVNLGIVPGLGMGSAEERSPGRAEVALEHNSTNRYQCRWVDLLAEQKSPSVFTAGMKSLHIPVAHGEGNFFADPGVLEALEREGLVALRYAATDGLPAGGKFPWNPNGSMHDIAALCDRSGRIMGMMPHPERGIFFTQRDDWPLLKEKAKRNGAGVPEESDGMMIFRNAVRYFG